jgi:membrane protein
MGRPGTSRVAERLRSWLNARFVAVDRHLGGCLTLLVRTWLAFSRDDGPTMAASIAYYALFSLFPLLLLLIAVGGMILAPPDAQQLALDLAAGYLPAATDLIRSNVDQVVRARSTIGALALVGLFWSASGVFGAIYRAVNRAWGHDTQRSFWKRKLSALLTTFSIGGLFVIMTVYSAMISFIRGWRVPVFGWQPFADPGIGRLVGWISALVPLLASIALFTLIYRTMPRASVTWRDVWPGGLAAGLVWETAKQLFTWYLANFARYSLVYGSLGAIIAFLFWSYLSAVILLLGAELAAQYSRWRRASPPVASHPLRQRQGQQSE